MAVASGERERPSNEGDSSGMVVIVVITGFAGSGAVRRGMVTIGIVIVAAVTVGVIVNTVGFVVVFVVVIVGASPWPLACPSGGSLPLLVYSPLLLVRSPFSVLGFFCNWGSSEYVCRSPLPTYIATWPSAAVRPFASLSSSAYWSPSREAMRPFSTSWPSLEGTVEVSQPGG